MVSCQLEKLVGSSVHRMEKFSLKDGLVGISLRHLEVFSTVVHEGSYANAALDLHMSRTNVKRICEDFEKIVGRGLLEESGKGQLVPTLFGQGLFSQLGPLSTSLRKLEEGVRQLHQSGRILRFGAAAGFFRGGLFTDYLARLSITGKFRSCFMKVEPKDAQKSLLAASCDVYFGVGLGGMERLDLVELGEVGWEVSRVGGGKLPKNPEGLEGKWFLVGEGDAGICSGLLDSFRTAGAKGGKVIERDSVGKLEKGAVIFTADMIRPLAGGSLNGWPGYKFSAVLRRHHPYSDLKDMLSTGAGKEGVNGY